jgi:hypothetical protein
MCCRCKAALVLLLQERLQKLQQQLPHLQGSPLLMSCPPTTVMLPQSYPPDTQFPTHSLHQLQATFTAPLPLLPLLLPHSSVVQVAEALKAEGNHFFQQQQQQHAIGQEHHTQVTST